MPSPLAQTLANQQQLYGFYPHLNPKVPGKPDTLGTPEAKGKLAEALLSVAPGSGEALSARDAWNASGRGADALTQGNYGQAASEYGNMFTGLLGAVPGAGVIARGTKRGAAWMNDNLPAGVNKLLDSLTPSDPANTLNIFAGPTAKTADHAALTKAQELAQSGANRDEIWNHTGWFQGNDGKWRFEIDDSASQFSAFGVGGDPFRKARTMDEAMQHPELFNAYPDMGNYTLGRDAAKNSGHFDAVYPGGPRVTVGQSLGDGERSIALHEMQHGVQHQEGFARGGSPFEAFTGEYGPTPLTYNNAADLLDSFGDDFISAAKSFKPEEVMLAREALADGEGKVRWARDILDRKAREFSAPELYRRLSGETEARNVQSRMNMNAAERRAKAPWLTQDVPDEQQIVRFR